MRAGMPDVMPPRTATGTRAHPAQTSQRDQQAACPDPVPALSSKVRLQLHTSAVQTKGRDFALTAHSQLGLTNRTQPPVP